MHGLIIENQSFGNTPSVKDLARHLYTRMLHGKVVIVTDKPLSIVGPLRRQWNKLYRRVLREQSSSLNAIRLYEIGKLLPSMITLSFTTHYPPDERPADVYIATVDKLLAYPPECRTLYVTYELDKEQLHLITAWMPRGSVVVFCKLT